VNRRRDRSVVFCLSIFDAGGSVRGCMGVHKHTHCTWDAQCEPRGRDDTLGRALKNPDGPNLGEYVFVHVYSVHICEYFLCVCCEAG